MKKILVVDDDSDLRDAIQGYLEHLGYFVECVGTGMEGLAYFEQEQPDVVVSDVMMPEMDGLEFCRRLRMARAGQLVPFIFLSSKGQLEDRLRGHSSGADDYISKPFEPRELIAKIESQLERSRRTHSELLRLIQTAEPRHEAPERLPLTTAEEKVFWEVVQGYTNKQIGERLFISPRTVQTHLSNILGKLHLENRSQLVRYAFERGHRLPEEQKIGL